MKSKGSGADYFNLAAVAIYMARGLTAEEAERVHLKWADQRPPTITAVYEAVDEAIAAIRHAEHKWVDITTFDDQPSRRYLCAVCGATRTEEPDHK